MVYLLFRSAVSGHLNTAAKSFGTTSRSVSFSESPAWFVVSLGLQALLTVASILVTVVLARLVITRIRVRK
jgi:hypothetical protein